MKGYMQLERETAARHGGTAREVFAAFLKLGLTSFGGPIAHLGYFHRELVAKRGWVSEAQYGQLLALCQFLPGPSSSQVGFALGLIRAGWLGALAAFVAFTLPSAALLLAFASAADYLSGTYGQATIHGLKLVAVAVVADGVRRMAKQLTPDAPRALIAAGAAAIVLTTRLPVMQLVVVAGGAIAGQWLCRHLPRLEGASFFPRFGPRLGTALLAVFAVLLVLALVLAESRSGPMLANASAGFYRAGALVFGGGHVVLPLLQQTVVQPGWVTTDEFLAGYGAAQAVPGPMFTLSAFLGARLDDGSGGALGASVCLLAIMLPGLLLVAGSLPWWSAIGRHPHATRALAGVNAAVVGLLVAALYQPVWTSAVQSAWDFATALVAFVLLASTRVSTLWSVAWCIVASIVRVSFA
ncbi:MAG TPA: chromate efflux transporter [Steroidobacter sp.]